MTLTTLTFGKWQKHNWSWTASAYSYLATWSLKALALYVQWACVVGGARRV